MQVRGIRREKTKGKVEQVMKRMTTLLLTLVLCFTLCAAAYASDVGIVLPTKDEPRWLQDQARFESVIPKLCAMLQERLDSRE